MSVRAVRKIWIAGDLRAIPAHTMMLFIDEDVEETITPRSRGLRDWELCFTIDGPYLPVFEQCRVHFECNDGQHFQGDAIPRMNGDTVTLVAAGPLEHVSWTS